LQLFGKDLERDVLVVAEIGVNHEGDVAAAERLITLAHEAGVDAVKLQSYTPERFASAADPVRLERVRRFCLDRAAHLRLDGHAQRIGATVFSTCVTEDVIPLLAELFPAIKVASGDINFEVLVRAAVRTGKPVILSTGNADVEEIDRAVQWCRDEAGAAVSERIAILHCVSAYPAPIEQANVRGVPFLKQRYGLTTGYSNHAIGPDACLAAVALGAQIVEVHFTDRREGRQFRDHALSFEPAELAALVRSVGQVHAALGQAGKPLQPAELEIRTAMRKGVVAARDLSAGTVLQAADLMYARPATEFAAAELPSLIGMRLTTPVLQGQLIPRAGVSRA
jgi:N,N'-diacetyllegionaminate synthase